MYKGKTVAAVIPAHNEELLIGRVIDTMPSYVDKIIIVDDCSTDQTAQIVHNYQVEFPERIYLLQHKINQGVGGAFTTGYKWCRDHEMDITVAMDGDGQMDPDDLPALLDPIANDEVDYTKGNRLFSGKAWKEIPRIRYLGNASLSLLTKIASGYWHVADSQSGYRVANLKVLKTLNLDNIYKKYGMPNDMLVKLNIHNFRVRDVPIRAIYNIGEKSGFKPVRIIPSLSRLIAKLFFIRMVQKYIIRDFHPLIFFYFLAIFLLGLCGPVLTIRLAIIWVINGHIPSINALALMMVTIAGIQFLLFAMWFDMEDNRDLR
ncbi:MAG: glycosyltransferase family 2 protein [Firmicutes bacterium HGW-Firmicutes-15]|nr:MAG: glycosyltransferase family 2 protein [Firmicutes bacterium HGW-Firmicutes-15]